MIKRKTKRQLPRNGRYELFTSNGRTYCFDDPDITNIPTKQEMFDWIRSQDPALWSPMKQNPDDNIALYLEPELYMLWKLKWV